MAGRVAGELPAETRRGPSRIARAPAAVLPDPGVRTRDAVSRRGEAGEGMRDRPSFESSGPTSAELTEEIQEE